MKTTKMEDILQETLASLLQRLGVTFRKFRVEESKTTVDEKTFPVFRIDIDTDEAGLLIGYYGETIYALQHILKTVIWQKTGESVFISVDVDSYRKRQEDSVKKLAERKVDTLRKTQQEQLLPPMSPYFRRVVHMHLAGEDFKDVVTESVGEGDQRQIVIKMR